MQLHRWKKIICNHPKSGLNSILWKCIKVYNVVNQIFM
jgi:hypothetical protein